VGLDLRRADLDHKHHSCDESAASPSPAAGGLCVAAPPARPAAAPSPYISAATSEQAKTFASTWYVEAGTLPSAKSACLGKRHPALQHHPSLVWLNEKWAGEADFTLSTATSML
jgi:hypothetical protein